MADPLAEVSDFEAWLGESIDDEDRPRAVSYLRMASNLVRRYAGAVRVEAGGEVADEAVDVTLSVASRVWANPTSATQLSDTTGADTHSESFGSKGADGFYLTASEKLILGQESSTPGLWVQPTSRGDLTQETILVNVLGGSPVPLFDREPF